jgi:hypothetical protein
VVSILLPFRLFIKAHAMKTLFRAMTAWAALSLAIFAAVMQTILSQSGERPER